MADGATAPEHATERPCRNCGSSERQRGRCVTCTRRITRESKQRRETGDPSLRLFRAARTRARMAGVEFTLTVEDIRAVYPVDGRCPVLGIMLEQGRGAAQDRSPTLDRINPSWGYRPGNICVMSLTANRAKGGMTAAQLSRVVTWMLEQGLT